MLALKILDVKDFMNKLLIGEVFDSLQVVEASITTFNTFTIDGKLHRDFFDTDVCKKKKKRAVFYSSWKELKPFCYSVIRGKRTPLSFKLVFQLSQKQRDVLVAQLSPRISPEQIQGFFLNLQYRNQELLCTTGVALSTFLPDKSPEQLWDSTIRDFFTRHRLIFEEL